MRKTKRQYWNCMLNWPINKTKNNITNKLGSSVVLFTLCSLNFIMEINKRQTANEQGQQFSWFIFLQKGKANNKSVTSRLAAPAFIIMPTKIPWTAMRYITSTTITSQLAIGVSFAVSRQLAYPVQRSHSRLNLQIKTSFNIDSISSCTRFLEGFDSAILTLVPWITNSRPICLKQIGLAKIWTTIWIFLNFHGTY